MDQFVRDGFVVQDGTEITGYGDGTWLLTGRIDCAGSIVLEVEKTLAYVDGEGHATRVQTVSYRYNARLPGRGVIFRYESPSLDGHRPDHHVHRFDVLNGDSDGTVASCDWPLLSKVIVELRDWYYANYDAIKATLGPPP